jgi:transposase
MVKNQLHAELHEAEPNQRSLGRLNVRIRFLNAQEKEIKSDIDQIVKEDNLIKKQVEIISSIPGIGKLTATIILAETNGFELIRNKKQLSSYAGFDVKEKQSGTSVKGKPRISKKGNRNLRKAMYLPSITAVKWDDNFKDLYIRIVSKQGIKKKGLVAVQRRLLEMSYTILKKEERYDKKFETNKQKNRAQIHEV